jgi:hypothetical protein
MKAWSVIGLLFAAAIFATIPISAASNAAWSRTCSLALPAGPQAARLITSSLVSRMQPDEIA